MVTETDGKRAALFAIQAGTETGGNTGARPKKVSLAEFAAAEPSSTQPYQVTGTVTNLTNAQYGVFDLTDGTTTIRVNGLTSTDLGYGAQNDRSFHSMGIKATDNITIAGYRGSFNFEPQVEYAYIVRVNAKGSGEEASGASGSGTQADPFNVAAAINYIISHGDTESTENIYVKGKVSKIQTAFSATKNGTFWISDDGTYSNNDNTKDFEAYNVKWLGNAAWTTGNSQLAVGDEVVLYGIVTKYTNSSGKSTYETSSNKAYVYSWNGNTTDPGVGSTEPGPGDTPATGASGSGTLADPFNIAGAISYIDNNGADNVYVKGKISAILYAFDATHETATFWISDDGTAHGISADKKSTTEPAKDFEAYGVKWLGNAQWAEGNSQPAVGDEVILYGKLTKYNTTYETSNKNAYVYSWKGNTTDPNAGTGGGGSSEPDPSTGGGDTPATGGSTVTLDLTAQGYANSEVFTSLTVSGVTMTGDKGSNGNTPKYYNTGTAVRFYGGNTFTISSTNTITKITFTFSSGEGSNEISANTGSFATPDWTGSSNSVTFTVGGTTGHRRISKVEVTLQ